MNPLPRHHLLLAVLLLAGVGLPRSHAQSAATVAPADSSVFVELVDFATLRPRLMKEPAVQYLLKRFPDRRTPPGWRQLEEAMGMKGEEILDRYFGRSFAAVGERMVDGGPALFALRAEPEDAALAVDRLKMTVTETRGDFTGHLASDGKAGFAVGRGWVLAGDRKHGPYAQAVVDGVLKDAPKLADDAVYRRWIAKLPATRSLTGFLRDAGNGQFHALSAGTSDSRHSATYVGESPEFVKIFDLLGDAGEADFGPLPAGVLAAATINLNPAALPLRTDADPNLLRALDQLAAPKSWAKDFAPAIRAPLVVFVGQVPAGKPGAGDAPGADAAPGMDLPTAGVMFRLKDPRVADDLTLVLDKLMVFALGATMQWKTDPVVVASKVHLGTPHRSANLGRAVSQRTGRPEFASYTLTYGRVGDWYVVCTHDHFFEQCVEAQVDPAKRMSATTAYVSLGLRGGAAERKAEAPGAGGPVTAPAAPAADAAASMFTVVVFPSRAAAQIESLLRHWAKVRPDVLPKDAPEATPEQRFLFGAELVAGVAKAYPAMGLQMRREGSSIHAWLELARP